MEKNKFLKIAAIGILFIFLFTSAAQASYQPNKVTKIIEKASSSFGGNGKGLVTWQDEFDDATKIDPSPPGAGASDNYVVGNSKVTVINTYPVWTDPAWTKMKPITITNSGGQVLTDYALKLTINHESGMQSAYQDIRFKHENNPTIWLDYWIERYNATVAHVWVEIPTIPIGTSTIYLFYGNPSATSQSNFDNVFSWQTNWGDDEKITNHANNEGTWDPDVAYGNGEFLVAWEEGTTFIIKQEIRTSIYDSSGNKLVDDELVFSDETIYYRNENPSIDYGGGKYFVAWEHYGTGASGVTDPSTMDIKGRTVVRNGEQLTLGSVIDVCIATDCQADANVQFDSVNNRFCVVWEDARNGETNYNIYGRLYDTNGNPVGSEKGIATATYSQCEPWVAFDPIHERYMIVWEEGITPNNGPFSLKAGLFDENLNQIGSSITIATGSDSVDYNFPCVEFSQETQRFLVTWNNDDISSGDWWGNVWGKIFDASGNLVVNTFQISSGEFVRTDIVPYLSSSFFVSFNSKGASGSGLIWGKIVSFDGIVSTSDVQLSASANAQADWANLAVGDGRIFTAWEDIRIDYPYPWNDMPDVYGNMWWLQMAGSSVTYSIGTEKQIVLTAHITSIKIIPTNLNKWNIFDATYTDGTITFDILDGTTGALLLQGVMPGTNLQNLAAQTIRLKATFTRANPSTTPKLDKWSVKWEENDPPNTPSSPNPANGATDVPVTSDLSWTGGDPNGDPVTYDVYFGTASSPPKVVSNQSSTTYDPGTMNHATTYYWKIVAWDNHGASTSGSVWHFATHNDPPNTPSSPNPANGATGVSTVADLSWTGGDPNGDPVTYDVYFGTTTPPTTKVSNNQSGTSYDPGTMSYNTKYYWKIVAWDNHGASASGPIWDFTTENRAPYTPSSPNPTNHETNVSTIADLSWTGGDPDPGDIVTYDVYFGTTSPPPKIVNNQSATTYDPGTMSYNTKYYWKIVAWDNHGASASGSIWDFTTCVNGPPYTPSNPSPSNGATDVSVDTDLSWTGGDPNPGDIVTYDVYFGTTSSPPQVVWGQSGTSYDPGTMQSLTTYYWKIVAWDNHGLSAAGPIWHFTTIYVQNNPPYTPQDPIPQNHATDVSINTDISWTGGDPDPYDTVTYDVYFGTTSPPPKIINNQSATTYDPGALTYGTTYYWRIVAWDNHGASASSPIWDFTTHNDPPNTPSSPNPANHATGISVSADLSWTGGDPNPGDTVTYDVYFGTTSPPPQVASGQSGTTYDPPGNMNYNTQYYWKIVAHDNHGASNPGPIWDFTTENLAPNQPSDPSPSDGATGVSVNVDLSWTGGDPDGDTVTYDVYFGDYSPPPLVASGQSGTTYDPGTMYGSRIYFWKIVAHDNHGGSTEGPVWQFTTEVNPNSPPNEPSNPNPANGATGILVTANLSWTGGDPDPGDIVTYDVYFGTTSPPPQVVWGQSGATYNPPGNMNYNTQYYWKIVAHDNHGASNPGPIWDFTTEQEQINDPPYPPTINGPFVIIIGQPYDFTFQASDQDNDNIKYIVNWGDGAEESSEFVASGTSVTLIHTWSGNLVNLFQITAKAEDVHGAQSGTTTHLLLGIKNQQSQQSQPQSQQQQQQSQPSGQMILRSIIRQTTNT